MFILAKRHNAVKNQKVGARKRHGLSNVPEDIRRFYMQHVGPESGRVTRWLQLTIKEGKTPAQVMEIMQKEIHKGKY